jgi:hypothetical protein
MSLSLASLFLQHLLLDSTANLRQKALVSLGALFGNVIARMYSLVRGKSQGHQSDELQRLVVFIEALLGSMLDCLERDRHRFSSTDLALRILYGFCQALEARQKSKGYRESTQYDTELEALLTSVVERTLLRRSDLLLKCILDNSFDTNRRLARDIVVHLCKDERMTLQLRPRIEESRIDALKRLASPKESLADGASLLLLLVPDNDPFDAYLKLLALQLAATREDMASAAATNNLNGTLCLLGHLLDRQKIPSSATMSRLKTLAIEVGNEVAALASQSSPEGSDLGQFAGVLGGTRTIQLVLTFCWRVIKESSYHQIHCVIITLNSGVVGMFWPSWFHVLI